MKQSLRIPTERTNGRRCGVDDCLEIGRTKNGWGLFAVVEIPAGTVVLKETPLAAIRTLKFTVGGSEELAQKLSDIGPLGPKEKTLMESLADRMLELGATRDWLKSFYAQAARRITVRDLAIAVASANGFAVATKFTATVFAFALYDLGSVFNHSCQPNVLQFSSGETTADMIFRTQTQVAQGSELTVTYLVGLDEIIQAAPRQASTKLHYGFVCRCQRCQRESDQPTPVRKPLSQELLRLMNLAKTAQLAGQLDQAWSLYWTVVTNHVEHARNLSQGNRIALLLGASCCGVAQEEPDPVRLAVILRKLRLTCQKGSYIDLMTQARQSLAQASLAEDLETKLEQWQLCLKHLGKVHGDENLCLDIEYLTCPLVRKTMICIRDLAKVVT